jgi:hypothetical protein
MRLTVLIVAAGLLWPSLSFSQDSYRAFADGNALYSACSSPNKDYCAGYVAAMSDALQREKYVCMPVEVKLAQAVDVVMNYLRDHPEQRNYNAMSLGQAALAPAFPCK